MTNALGWKQLRHQKMRLSVAIVGIGFAVVLVLMQLGFRSSLLASSVRHLDSFRSDLALLDPDGIVRDMARNFPGDPSPGILWTRAVTIAAVPATLSERCTVEESAGLRTWRCVGTAQGPEEGSARLYEVTSETTVVADRRGLVSYDSRWAGTLVVLAPDQQGVIDRPIAGHRVVERRPPDGGGG